MGVFRGLGLRIFFVAGFMGFIFGGLGLRALWIRAVEFMVFISVFFIGFYEGFIRGDVIRSF